MEARSKHLQKKYNVTENVVALCGIFDPTKGKALEWILRNKLKKNLILPEDGDRVLSSLTTFFQLKRSPKLLKLHGVNSDLNYYTFHSLEEVHRTVNGVENYQSLLSEIPKGAEKVYDDGKYAVVKVTTPEAASALADSTSWCTRHLETAKQYLSCGPLFVFFKDSKKIGQATISGEFRDINDVEITIHNMDLIEAFFLSIKSLPHLYSVRCPSYEKYILSKLNTPNCEIHFSLLLSYYKKFPIFRWSDAEPFLMKNPSLACSYASIILKGRWIEAEPYIMKDPSSALTYARYILNKPWPEAEPYLLSANNLSNAIDYAVVFKGSKWPELEKLLANSF